VWATFITIHYSILKYKKCIRHTIGTAVARLLINICHNFLHKFLSVVSRGNLCSEHLCILVQIIQILIPVWFLGLHEVVLDNLVDHPPSEVRHVLLGE